MENFITITPGRKDAKDCLIVSLTIDGANYLSNLTVQSPEQYIHDLYDNTPDKAGEKMVFSKHGRTTHPDGSIEYEFPGTIYTQVFIPQENKSVTAKAWNIDKKENAHLIKNWCENPKFEATYFADKDNDSRMDEIRTKLAANHWAVYSDEKLAEIAIIINKRHIQLKGACERLHESILIFKKGQHKNDSVYNDLLQNTVKEIEREMDYCIEKMKICQLISNGQFQENTTVAKAYRKFRGVEEKKPEKLNVKVQEHGTEEKETDSPSGTEGQNDQSEGPVGSN